MGVFMVHDSTVYAAHAEHTEVIKFLQDKRLSFPLDRMETVYYWDAGDTVRVSPETVRFVLHTGGGRNLLVVFNRGDEPVEATELWTFVRPNNASWMLSAIQQTA